MRIVYALWLRSIKLFIRNKVQLAFTIIMPFFFLYVFGNIFKAGNIDDPFIHMLVGIVITNVFQTSLTIASSTIDDIVSGFMKEVIVSPVKRIQIALGQIFAAATISAFQGVITLAIGMLVGLRFESALTPIYSILTMIVVGIVFSGLGLFIATMVKNSQTFQIVLSAITMPFTFLCGAYIPIVMLPDILKYVAYINPMTYTTAFFRAITMEKMSHSSEQLLADEIAFKFGNFVVTPWISAVIILIFGALFLLMSTIVFSRVDFSKINRSKSKEDDIYS